MSEISNEWDAETNVNMPLLDAETVAQHLPEVLEALKSKARPLMISLDGEVSAVLIPMTAEGVRELLWDHFPAMRQIEGELATEPVPADSHTSDEISNS